jgi:hydrogenase maturation protease
MPRNSTILVLGLGNSLLSDDGVGIHVVEALRGEFGRRPDISLRDGGTLGLVLLPEIEDAGAVILVDASEVGGAPGDVRVFEGEAMDRQLGGTKRTAHEVAAADLLDAAALTGQRPERRALVAIQAASTEWGLSPTSPVASAIPAACDRVRALIERWSA